MIALNLILFISLITAACCGLISPDRNRLYGDSKPNSDIINIKNQQQQQLIKTNLNHHIQDGPRGDHGDDHHHDNEAGMQSIFKSAQVSMNRGSSNMFTSNYNNQLYMSDSSSDFHDTMKTVAPSSKLIDQKYVKHDEGHKFDHHNSKTKSVCQCLKCK